MENWNIIEIENKIIIPFHWKDRTPGAGNLGRAEFIVCLKFKRGRSEFWVYPAQQRDMKDAWHYTYGSPDFSISSYEGLDDAKVWLFFPCKEHKTTSFRLYAPTDSRYLRIDHHGISFLKSRLS